MPARNGKEKPTLQIESDDTESNLPESKAQNLMTQNIRLYNPNPKFDNPESGSMNQNVNARNGKEKPTRLPSSTPARELKYTFVTSPESHARCKSNYQIRRQVSDLWAFSVE